MKDKVIAFILLLLPTWCSSTKAEVFEGELTVLQADMLDGTTEVFYELETKDGPYELVGPITLELPLLSEIQISVEGELHGLHEIELSNFAVHADLGLEAEIRAELAATERRAVAVIVDMPTKKAPTTPANWAGLFGRMDSYYRAASMDQLSFPVDANKDGRPDVFGPYTVQTNESACSYSSAASLARQQAPYAAGAYQHEMFVLPTGIGCGWLGLAQVGCRDRCILWTSSQDNLTVLAHEMGHNLNLHHSARDTNDDGNLESEYGDHSGVMGNYFEKAVGFVPPNLEVLGWYNSKPNWLAAYSGGAKEFKLLSLASPEVGNPQVIKWPRQKGGNYYLAYRHPESNDAGLKPDYAAKVNIYHWAGSAQSRWIGAIAQGATVNVGGVPVTFRSVSGNVATVVMGQGNPTPPTPQPPAPPTPPAPPGSGKRMVTFNGKCGASGQYERLLQYSCDGSARQVIEVVPAQAGLVLIKNGGRCLDIGGGSWANNATVYFTACHGRGNQLFKMLPQGDNTMMVATIGGASEKCLDVYAMQYSEGARITQWSCNSSARSQRFKFD